MAIPTVIQMETQKRLVIERVKQKVRRLEKQKVIPRLKVTD